MHEDPHTQLMLRFQDGDEDAYKQLYEYYKRPLLNFIYRFCQDRRVSEELSQEVFLRVYKTVARYRPEARFSTWIYRIATNVCLNEVRSGKYRYEFELKNIHDGDENKLFDAADQRTRIKTDEKIVDREREQAVRKAIAGLPKKQRLALIYSAYEQLSYQEIGQRMGCSDSAVKSIVHRAKLALKDILKKRFSELL